MTQISESVEYPTILLEHTCLLIDLPADDDRNDRNLDGANIDDATSHPDHQEDSPHRGVIPFHRVTIPREMYSTENGKYYSLQQSS
jgi:hypothetical protein